MSHVSGNLGDVWEELSLAPLRIRSTSYNNVYLTAEVRNLLESWESRVWERELQQPTRANRASDPASSKPRTTSGARPWHGAPARTVLAERPLSTLFFNTSRKPPCVGACLHGCTCTTLVVVLRTCSVPLQFQKRPIPISLSCGWTKRTKPVSGPGTHPSIPCVPDCVERRTSMDWQGLAGFGRADDDGQTDFGGWKPSNGGMRGN